MIYSLLDSSAVETVGRNKKIDEFSYRYLSTETSTTQPNQDYKCEQ